MDFVAIDFETANHYRGSACELGLSVVRAGAVTETRSWLIRPQRNYFHPNNVRIHGIDAARVADAPEFGNLWPTLLPYLEGHTVVAHNASFDTSVLRFVLRDYGLPFPSFRYTCSLQIARRAWQGLPSYRLNALAERFDIDLRHHSAGPDARASALLVLAAAQGQPLEALLDGMQLRFGQLFPGGYQPAGRHSAGRHSAGRHSAGRHSAGRHSAGRGLAVRHAVAANSEVARPGHPFFQQEVVFAGRLRQFRRDEATRQVWEIGGWCSQEVTTATRFLVLGDKELKQWEAGVASSRKLARARQQRGVRVLSEAAFGALLGQHQ